MKSKCLSLFKTYALITGAAVIYAFAFNWCFVPNFIGFGGITGVAQVINAVFGTPSIGVLVIVLNVPLFLLGWRFLGGHLLVSSLFAMGISSVFIDLFNAFVVFEAMDPLLACLYGGVLMGVAMGITLLQGATTGGTDLLARLIKLKLAWLPIGRVLLFLDLAVIALTAVAFGNLNSALYGLVALYITTLVMDFILYGMDNAKVAYIISDRSADIVAAIIAQLDRGVTILHGEGGWSGEEKRVLMCAFKQREIVAMKKLVKLVDPDAFLIVCDAHEVLGDGFRAYSHNNI